MAWNIVGLWNETRAVALACDVLRHAGGTLLEPWGSRRAAGAAHLPGSASPATLRLDDEAMEAINTADVVVADRRWDDALKGAGADRPSGQVRCTIAPWGTEHPWAHLPAVDLTVQAASGIVSTNGEDGDPPLRSGVGIADAGSALAASVGVLAALYERDCTGHGQEVFVAQEDVVVTFLTTLLPRFFLDGEEPPRLGNRHAMTAPWNAYPTSDGWVVISTMGNGLWARMTRLMSREELIHDPRFATPTARVENVSELDYEVASWTTDRSTDQALAELRDAGIPCSAISSFATVLGARVAGGAAPSGPPATDVWTTPPPFQLVAEHAPEQARRSRAAPRPAGGKPLEGLRVLELTAFTAGPLAGRLLGALGAEVLKVEPPQGENCRHLAQQLEGTSYLYHLNNTDKRCCVLDLTVDDQRQRFLELGASADVYLTNLAVPTLRKLGTLPDVLRASNPALVACAITGYGLASSRADERAFDSVIQAASGVMHVTGRVDGPPLKTAVSMADLLTGWASVAGILAALRVGRETRTGSTVDAGLHDAAFWAVFSAWLEWAAMDAEPEDMRRAGNRHPSMVPHGCFSARDGWVAIAVRDDAQWSSFSARLEGLDSVAGSWRLAQRRDQEANVEAAVSRWVAGRTVDEVLAELRSIGAAGAPVQGLRQVAEHHLAEEDGVLTRRPLPSGQTIPVLRLPLRFSRSRIGTPSVAPALASSRPCWRTSNERS